MQKINHLAEGELKMDFKTDIMLGEKELQLGDILFLEDQTFVVVEDTKTNELYAERRDDSSVCYPLSEFVAKEKENLQITGSVLYRVKTEDIECYADNRKDKIRFAVPKEWLWNMLKTWATQQAEEVDTKSKESYILGKADHLYETIGAYPYTLAEEILDNAKNEGKILNIKYTLTV